MSPYPDQGARNSRTSSSRPSFGNSSGARGSYGPRDRYQNDRKRPGKFREEKVLPLPVVDPADHSAAFTALGVPVPLLDALVTAGIGEPFPVQTATLPDALAGRDVCGRAPTGSGKTLAYGLAVLGRIERANPTAPKALILVPTRELAKQVAEVLVPYSRVTKRWVTAFFGGAGMARQISDLQRGVDVAVATPGRLLDLINRGEARLDEVTMVVIDEADRMADMGFTPQVRQLLDDITGPRQVLLFSATLDGDVDDLVSKYMNDPVVHDIGGVEGEDELEAAKRARHVVVQTKFESKYQDLASLMKDSKRAIIFVKNRFGTERAADAMNSLGVSALAMHGGMSQNARESALKRWAQGDVVALFATDVAARGVHVAGVETVIHLDPPQDEKDYIHRSGRTARAGAHGLVINFFRKEQLKPASAMHRRLGVTVESASIEQAQELLVEVRNLNAGIATGSEGTATETWTMSTISEVDPMADEWVDSPGRSGSGGGFGDRDRGPRAGGFGDRSRGGFGGDRPRGDRSSFGGDRPSFADRQRSGGFDRARPSFDRPERSERPAFDRGERPSFDRGDRPSFDRGPRPGGDRPSFDRDRPRGDRPDRPAFDRSPRPGGFERPAARTGGFDRGPRPGGFDRDRPGSDRPFRSDRPGGSGGFDRAGSGRPAFGDRPDRGDRPGGFRPGGDRDRPFSGGRPSFDRGGDRPGGFERGGDRPFRPSGDRPFSGGRPGGERDRPFSSGRPSFDRSGPGAGRGDRPSFDRDRPRTGGFGGGDRPSFDRDRPRAGGFREDRPAFNRDRDAKPTGEREWKPRSSAPSGDRGYGARPERPGGFRSGPSDERGGRDRNDRPSFNRDRNAPFVGRSERSFDRDAPRADAGGVAVAPRPSWRSEGAGDGDRPKRVRPPRK
jgi:superfamily II DNA/RNA helicase